MSLYRTFIAATQAANTVNARKTALATGTLLERQQAEDDRRVHVEELRQVVFEGAKVVRAAADTVVAAPAAALYLALQLRPTFGPGGVSDRDLPDLTDKAFHHQTVLALSSVEAAAKNGLSLATIDAVERLTWLERAEPLVRQLAVWRDLAGLVSGLTATIEHPGQGTLVRLGRAVLFFVGVGLFAAIPVEIVLGHTVTLVFQWLVFAVACLMAAQAVKAPRVVRRARALFAELGAPLPPGLTDAEVPKQAATLAAALASDGGGALAEAGDLRAAADALARERQVLWARVFSGLTPEDGVGDHGGNEVGATLRLPA